MTTSITAATAATRIARVIGALERVPYSLLAIPLRLAVATVFWNSGMTKLANWDATLQLFEDEYKVPLLPPDIAAYIGASIELSTPVLLVLGFLTRPAALVLLGMTSIIEILSIRWPGPRISSGRPCCWCCCAAVPAHFRSTICSGGASACAASRTIVSQTGAGRRSALFSDAIAIDSHLTFSGAQQWIPVWIGMRSTGRSR
jgi:putative oxidoreductase